MVNKAWVDPLRNELKRMTPYCIRGRVENPPTACGNVVLAGTKGGVVPLDRHAIFISQKVDAVEDAEYLQHRVEIGVSYAVCKNKAPKYLIVDCSHCRQRHYALLSDCQPTCWLVYRRPQVAVALCAFAALSPGRHVVGECGGPAVASPPSFLRAVAAEIVMCSPLVHEH